MSTHVSPEELQAILELVQPALRARAEVADRDFRQPKRLPSADLDVIASRGAKAIPAIEAEIATWLRDAHEVAIASASEANAAELVRGLTDPAVVFAFECAGKPCVALWESTACVAIVETALGASAVKEPKPRALSGVEIEILRTIVGRIASAVCGAFSLEAKNLRVVQDAEGRSQLEIVQPGSDPQRVGVHLAIDGAVGSSNLRFYLALETRPKTDAAAKEKPARTLPQHLGAVSVELGAELGCADIPLSELLGIEVGDVIPLAVDVGSPLAVRVEGKPCGTAKWGENKGSLAIRIQSFTPMVNELARTSRPSPSRP